MARKLSDGLFEKPKEELKVSLADWQAVKQAILDVKIQLKNAEGSSLFVHSKMVKLFDKLQEHINQIKITQKELEYQTEKQLEKMHAEMESFSQMKEQEITNQVKNIIDKHQSINKQYSNQLQDLSQHITLQSEQMWSLTDQLQEIKEEILTSPKEKNL